MKFSERLITLSILIIIVFVVVGCATRRTTALGIEIQPHPAVPVVMTVTANDTYSVAYARGQGTNQSGEVPYQRGKGDRIEFEFWWIERHSGDAWHIRVPVRMGDLSTFRSDRRHASLKIDLGPGADVTIKTPHPELLRHIANNTQHLITPEMDEPVVLQELCAQPMRPDDPALGPLRERVAQGEFYNADRNYQSWVARNPMPVSRCLGENYNVEPDNVNMSDELQDCDLSEIRLEPSAMGIDYTALYPSPLAEILSQGEAERLAPKPSNPSFDYSSYSDEIRKSLSNEWTRMLAALFDGTMKRTFSGAPDEPSFDFLRAASPEMLARLKACGPAADPRLAYLVDIPLKSFAGDVE